MIRVLIVDDSLLICRILASIISADPELTVAGVAQSGEQAIALTQALKPDLITMDVFLGSMD